MTDPEVLDEDIDYGFDEPKPNKDQQQALEDFFSFMLSDNKYYHLTGGAGYGKTSTLDLLMREGLKRYEEGCNLIGIPQEILQVALTATTNKAAEVLSRATNLPVQTIHSFMNFRVFEDYSTGKTVIKATANTVVISNTLIIIDEASMIETKLLELLNKYTHKCKFLFVGDHCQMAPVFEKLSPIYKHNEYFSNLTVPVRNSGQPALMALCEQLRETVETGVFKPIKEVPGVIDYLDNDQMQETIQRIFINTYNNSRILCFTNNQVKNYNSYIRGIRNLPEYFTEGEILISANAYNKDKTSLSVEQEVEVVQLIQKEEEKSVFSKKDDKKLTFMTYPLIIKPIGKYPFKVNIPSDINHFNELVSYFKRNKDWIGYFHLTKEYPDLRPRDASTVYKAQGSTYESVIVDLGDISKCTHADQVARMLYVACSRPRSRLYLYGSLKPAYQGK